MAIDNRLLDILFGEKAGYLDIETLGTEAGNPIHQASLYIPDYIAKEYYPVAAATRTKGNILDPMRVPSYERQLNIYPGWPEAIKDYGDPFSQQKISSGDWGHLSGVVPQNRVASYHTTSIPTSVSRGMLPSEMTQDILKTAQGRILWVANLPFEAKHLGLSLAVGDDKALMEANKLFTYQNTRPNHFLLPGDPAYLKAKMLGQLTGDWRDIWYAVKNINVNEPGIKPVDIQDLIRSAQSFGKELSDRFDLGFDFNNIYLGTNLNQQAKILGLPKELHTATEDNMLSEFVGRRVGKHIMSIEDMLNKHRQGIIFTLDDDHIQALDYLYQMNLGKKTGSFYTKKSVALALFDKITAEQNNETYQHRLSDGHELYFTEKIKDGKRLSLPMASPRYTTYNDYNEVIRVLSDAPRNKGIDVRNIATSLQNEIHGKSSADALNYLQEVIHSTSANSENMLDEILHNVPESIINKVAKQGIRSKKTTNILSKMGLAGLGAGLIIGGIGLYKGLTQTYNDVSAPSSTIEGLNEDGYAAYLRGDRTDFGSPYRGLLGSISATLANSVIDQGTPVFVGNEIPIDQKIANFKQEQMQTPLQRQMIQAKLTKETLKSMSSTYFLDPRLTTPIASGDYFKYGFNRNKKLQEIDITKANYSIEDADTLVLRSGLDNFLGKSASIRLAGIDAPEIQHSDEGEMASLRYKQSQPYGEEARKKLEEMLKSAKSVKLVVDPQQDTYGRSLGTIIADGKNLNLELVKQGAALALPFGEAQADMVNRGLVGKFENMAYKNKEGLWKDNYWRVYKQTIGDRVRTTNNTLTRIDKLAQNQNLAGLEATMEYAQHNDIDAFVRQASNTLRPKLQKLGEKTNYEKNVINLNYNTSFKQHEQLAFETEQMMNNHGNNNTNLLKAKNSLSLNKTLVLDSLYQTNSSYRAEMPEIVKQYEESKEKKKYRAKLQRMTNKNMNQNTQNAGRW